MRTQTVKLIESSRSFKKEYLSFYEEWKASGEKMILWVIEKDPSHFDEMLQFLQNNEKGINIPDGWVPDTTY